MSEGQSIERASRPLNLALSTEELEERREHITAFVADRADAAGADRAVVALSGGVDSTLTAHLSVEALGVDGVHGLVLPSTVNRDRNMSDAERVAESLGIEYDVVEIDPLVEAVMEAYPGVSPDDDAEAEPLRTAVGNLRARLRAVLSYFTANYEDALVVGTGNRSEAQIGYFTKYGDGAVDCHPIANLYKGQVRQLAKHVGVPEDLAEKPASAGLWADQTDEDELGLDYETLDSVLALHVDGPVSEAATARHLGIDERVVASVRAMHEHSEHKRRAPPGPEPI